MTGVQRSLRVRLVGLTAVVVLASLAAVALLHQVATGPGLAARASRLLLGDEFPEPWQDVAVLIPFSAVVLILVWAILVGSLRPLVRASQQAALAGPRDPQARIDVAGLPGEMLPLVTAMNGALDRLAAAYEGERRFTQDAAHELRTPLAALGLRLQRARLESATDWPAIDNDLAQMNRLVAQLVDLARKEARGIETVLTPVNLARAAREAAASLLPLIEQAGRTLVVDLPETATVHGRAADLQDLVRNLLENALSHGKGCIRLQAWRDQATGTVILQVADEGAGVAAPLRQLVFDRFRKASQGGEGSGLGLAIARAVALAHGGTIGFLDGSGCTIRLVLPGSVGAPLRAEAPFAAVGVAA